MGGIVINIFTRERSEVTDESTETLEQVTVTPKIPRKRKTPEVDESVKQFFRDSLDNEQVKAKYKLTSKE